MQKPLSALSLVAAFAAFPALAQLPAAIIPPAGNKAVLTLLGSGELAYECKAVADKAGQFAWSFVGPNAKLLDADKKEVGKYYAGPTWALHDGSKVSGKQLAVAAGPAGAIPLQLVQTNPSSASGAMADVTYIQRLQTVGGVAPATPECTEANAGAKVNVPYQADYVFFKPQ